jgi:hypothetical protein
MADLIFVLSIFAAGTGFGYYLRDRISKKRHKQHLKSKQSKRSRNTIVSYLPRKRHRDFYALERSDDDVIVLPEP